MQLVYRHYRVNIGIFGHKKIDSAWLAACSIRGNICSV